MRNKWKLSFEAFENSKANLIEHDTKGRKKKYKKKNKSADIDVKCNSTKTYVFDFPILTTFIYVNAQILVLAQSTLEQVNK